MIAREAVGVRLRKMAEAGSGSSSAPPGHVFALEPALVPPPPSAVPLARGRAHWTVNVVNKMRRLLHPDGAGDS